MGHSSGPSRVNGSTMSGACCARPATTASSRATQAASKEVPKCGPISAIVSNVKRMAAGEIEPKAAMTASGPAGARGAARAAM